MEKTDSYVEHDWVLDYMFTYSEEEKQDIEIAKTNSKLLYAPRYIIIQTEWLKDLTLIQAYIFWFIDFYLLEDWKRFYFTNEQIASICNCWERTVQDSIQILEKLWYIETSRRVKSWWWQIRFIKTINHIEKNYWSDQKKTTGLTSKKLLGKEIYINNNNTNSETRSFSNEKELKQESLGVDINTNIEEVVDINNIKDITEEVVDIKKENKNKEISEDIEKLFKFWNDSKENDKLWVSHRIITDKMKTTLTRILKKYSKNDIELWLKKYKAEIKWRQNTWTYFYHRFTLIDFFTSSKWFEKYFNIA